MANCFQDGQILSSDPALLFHSLVFGLNINVISEFHIKRTGGSTIRTTLLHFSFLQNPEDVTKIGIDVDVRRYHMLMQL